MEVGKILIFDKKYYEPLDLVYKNEVTFQGEAVVIDEKFGIRIKAEEKNLQRNCSYKLFA